MDIHFHIHHHFDQALQISGLHAGCMPAAELREHLLFIITKLSSMANQDAQIKDLVQQVQTGLSDLLVVEKDQDAKLDTLVQSEQDQDAQLTSLITLAEQIKDEEASGADQTDTVNALTTLVNGLKSAKDASTAQTAKVQAAADAAKAQTDKVTAAMTVLNAPATGTGDGGGTTTPQLIDHDYSATSGETLTVSQAGDLPATGEAVKISGAAAAAGTYTLSDGATLVVDDSGNVVSYTAAQA